MDSLFTEFVRMVEAIWNFSFALNLSRLASGLNFLFGPELDRASGAKEFV
jgi:hypothetical protein